MKAPSGAFIVRLQNPLMPCMISQPQMLPITKDRGHEPPKVERANLKKYGIRPA
jgi:hypothetical protein